VAKYGLAVVFHMLVESNAWPSLSHNHLKPDLAVLQRIRSEILAIQFDQVEGVQKYIFVMVTVANAVERSDAGLVAGNRFPVDDAGASPGGLNG
jgi:hypothetical protein